MRDVVNAIETSRAWAGLSGRGSALAAFLPKGCGCACYCNSEWRRRPLETSKLRRLVRACRSRNLSSGILKGTFRLSWRTLPFHLVRWPLMRASVISLHGQHVRHGIACCSVKIDVENGEVEGFPLRHLRRGNTKTAAPFT